MTAEAGLFAPTNQAPPQQLEIAPGSWPRRFLYRDDEGVRVFQFYPPGGPQVVGYSAFDVSAILLFGDQYISVEHH